MENLVIFDGKNIIIGKNIDYIQIIRKHKKDDEFFFKRFEDGDFVMWLLKDPKIKEGKFLFMWTSLIRVTKALNNNIVQLSTLSNEDITLVNVNKLKALKSNHYGHCNHNNHSKRK
jgi:hypothetical protein